MGKLTLLVGIGIGYVIGTAAGREQFQKIKATVTDLVNKPQVQKVVRKADDFVADKAPGLHDVGAAVADATDPKPAPPAGATS